MPNLRDIFSVDNTLTGLQRDQVEAASMGDLRRGWRAGRIGVDANAALADLASARADEDEARAAELDAQVKSLRQRQGVFSPRVGRVEDINGVGDALDWAQGQVGQGSASMLDPVMAGTAMAGAGTAMQFVPNATVRALGTGLRTVGAFAAPYAINQRQLKGEAYGNMLEDPEVMAARTPQELNQTANMIGLGNAALDSIVPGMIGRGLGGAGLRAGLSSVGPGAKTLGGMAMEGLTETAQGEVNRQVLGHINPNRDTSGDMSARINEFAGGAIGAGPFTAAGAYADAGYRRAGAVADGTANLVKDAAGSVVDMYSGSRMEGAVDAGVDKAKGLFKRGKDTVVDLRSGDVTASDIVKDLKAKAKSGVDSLQAAVEERDILTGAAMEQIPQDAPDFEQQFYAFQDKRGKLIADRLGELADQDPKAAELFERAFNSGLDAAQQDTVLNEAGSYLVDRMNLGEFVDKAERTGGVAGKAAGFAGKVLRQAGEAGLTLGKAAWKGFAEGDKKNAQWTQADVDAEMADRQQAGARALSLERAKLMADFLAERTKQEEARYKTAKADADVEKLSTYMGDIGYEIADLADQLQLGEAQTPERTRQQYDSTKLALNRIANTLNSAYGPKALETLSELRTMAAPGSEPLFQALEEQLTAVQERRGASETYAVRRWAQDELLRAIDPATRNRLLRQGIDLNSGAGKRQLLGMVEAIATGRVKPGFDKELAKVLGRENLEAMLEVVTPPRKEFAEELVDDGGEIATTDSGLELDDDGEFREAVTSGYDQNMARKTVDDATGQRMYGFYDLKNARRDGEGRLDPFAPAGKATKAEIQAWEDVNRQRAAEGLEPDYSADPRAGKRPRLIPKNAEGKWEDASAIARMEKRLNGENWRVRTVSALEVLREMGVQPARALVLYRDYLRDDLARGKGDETTAQTIDLLNKAVLDLMDKGKEPAQPGSAATGEQLKQRMTRPLGLDTKDAPGRTAARLTPGIRKRLISEAQEYFGERALVVADRVSDRDVEELSVADVSALAEEGKKQQERVRRDGPAAATNLLAFKTSNLNDAGVAYFRAGDLVKMARERRAKITQTDFEDTSASLSNADKNKAYLKDLSDGIAMLVGSGHVEGSPQMMGPDGKRYSFKDGLPPVLRLATTTVGNLQKSKDIKLQQIAAQPLTNEPGGDARTDEAYQEQVARDQDRDLFTPDDAPDVNQPVTRMQTNEGVFNKYLYDFGNPDPLSADTKAQAKALSKTPLDVARKPKGGKSEMTGQPDEFADQRFRSVTQGYTASGEAAKTRAFPRGRMDDQGSYHGKQLVGALKQDFATGLDEAVTWLRLAQAPSYDKKGTTGGAHLTMPVAVAIADAGNMDLTPAEAKRLIGLGKEVLRILKESDLGKRDKAKIVSLIASKEAMERVGITNVVALNVDRFLDRYAAKEPMLLPSLGTDTMTRAERNAASDAALAKFNQTREMARAKAKPGVTDEYLAAENFEDVKTAAQADKLLKEAQARFAELKALDDLTDTQKKAYAVLDGWFGKSSTADLGSFYPDGRSDADVRKMLASAKEAGASVGKSLSRQVGGGKPATDAEIQAAKNYVAKVLGPQIKVDFQDITGYSGEWVEADNVVRISTTAAPGAMQTAYHEALHAFFSKFIKGEPKAFEVLRSLAENQSILERVHALLDGYPAAQAQLTSGEERLAYIYQFWASGMLDLPTKPKTLFQKLLRFFRGVLGRITENERATAVLEAFHAGQFAREPSAAGQVLAKAINEGMATTKMARRMDAAVQSIRSTVMPANSILRDSDSKEAQALAKDFWTNPGDGEDGGAGEGYLNARLREARRFTNLFSGYVQGLSDRDLKDVTGYLQKEADLNDIAYAPHRKAVGQIRKLLQRFRKYMVDERGMDIGDLGPNYFPRVWSPTALLGQERQFINMLLTKYAEVLQAGVDSSGGKLTQEQVAQRIFNKLISNTVGDHITPSRDDGVLSPFFAGKEIRELKWLQAEDVEPYLSKGLVETLTTYFHDGARSAEYTARFGQNGEDLEARLDTVSNELNEAALQRLKRGEFKTKADAEKWAERQMNQVKSAIGAMEGSLGKEISPTWRNASAWMTVYQNVRLLPMAIFASVVDPLGMVARGAEMKDAYETFLRGVREVLRDWGDLFRNEPKERQADHWEKLALAVGSVDAAMFSHHVSEEYSSAFMGKNQKRINDTFFKLNGMEAWNRGSRVGATRAAALFIQRHAKLPEVHSQRWLQELGLKPADITLDDEGNLITDKRELVKRKGISEQQAEREIDKLYSAIARWVEGAIITPNAAQRPSWSSDPHWSIFFHLKQFTYSFHQTILKRAVKEMGYGNMAPIGAFAWYIPVMIASDVTKGLIQGGGELPAHMKGMDMGDWMLHGVNRAGLLGVGQIGVDAGEDVSSLAGPMVEQVVDSFTQPLGQMTLRALPANSLYAEAFK